MLGGPGRACFRRSRSGLLPTYAAIGVLAPILLILLRMTQGASIGGEYTTSIIFLVEQSPPRDRGFIGSWAAFSTGKASWAANDIGRPAGQPILSTKKAPFGDPSGPFSQYLISTTTTPVCREWATGCGRLAA